MDTWVDRLLEHSRAELARLPLETPVDGTHVTAVMRLTGLDRFRMARLLGVDPMTLDRWERGMGVPGGAARTLLLIGLSFPETLRIFADP
ncbi:helix-turn-helix domain-containing protein [Alloalcanivorax sp. C16-2]|uniref:helix-turn-helix domain-containing protein n=1 Tax=Alloalcanivorax TaxID=3020832 RepID=UPI001933101C|nr:hypothetical protein [Alloalcanivorax marinus]MBL7250226.1 hypothetical protein [Alloalcanivorax marinus]